MTPTKLLKMRMLPGGPIHPIYPTDMHGGGFFDSVGNFFKKSGQWIKDQHLISKALMVFPHPGAKVAGIAAGALGFGKRHRGRGTRTTMKISM